MTKLPVPKHEITWQKDEWDDSVELGSSLFKFPDGRPVKVETWGENGYTFNTYFFSPIGLEDLAFNALMAYMRSQGVELDDGLSEDEVGVIEIDDDNGQAMWSVTIVVGQPD